MNYFRIFCLQEYLTANNKTFLHFQYYNLFIHLSNCTGYSLHDNTNGASEQPCLIPQNFHQ